MVVRRYQTFEKATRNIIVANVKSSDKKFPTAGVLSTGVNCMLHLHFNYRVAFYLIYIGEKYYSTTATSRGLLDRSTTTTAAAFHLTIEA